MIFFLNYIKQHSKQIFSLWQLKPITKHFSNSLHDKGFYHANNFKSAPNWCVAFRTLLKFNHFCVASHFIQFFVRLHVNLSSLLHHFCLLHLFMCDNTMQKKTRDMCNLLWSRYFMRSPLWFRTFFFLCCYFHTYFIFHSNIFVGGPNSTLVFILLVSGCCCNWNDFSFSLIFHFLFRIYPYFILYTTALTGSSAADAKDQKMLLLLVVFLMCMITFFCQKFTYFVLNLRMRSDMSFCNNSNLQS